ncbi:hypothetical protein GCM10023194_12200 [Planotetraspora phitsanulokensis]|uniref:Uncharacterized protein n=1 Tax=Planotetraspora phitsanulokensis TaxID=575192 RepID=A0A8J3URU4_9ACTN|nr:hypothetical protein [Planotetraspora phitsanulokensis]GII43455.1 hypothetical protein Pph01_84580 [Planotetraspora phitsanulokensis]
MPAHSEDDGWREEARNYFDGGLDEARMAHRGPTFTAGSRPGLNRIAPFPKISIRIGSLEFPQSSSEAVN